MGPSSRDRLSVDLHGLKAALVAKARSLGVTPSGYVRQILAAELRHPLVAEEPRPTTTVGPHDRVRLCLRMEAHGARAAADAARRHRMTLGNYIGGLVLAVPVLATGGSRVDHIAALTASSAELATLSRNIHRLTALLGQADVEPARQYRQMLDMLAGDVRGHLELAGRVLAALQPRGRAVAPVDR